MLERRGYTTTIETHNRAALEKFQANPNEYDVLITDQIMPILSGTELAEEVLQLRPDLPIILVTGFSETVTKEVAKDIGICDYIMKPVNANELIKVIQAILANKRLKRD